MLRNNLNTKKISIKKHAKLEKKIEEYTKPVSDGVIEIQYEWEKTAQLKQDDLLNLLDQNEKEKYRRFSLDFGPYITDYSRNGKFMINASDKGTIQLYNAISNYRLIKSTNLLQTIYDAKICYNETCIAVANKNSICILDKQLIIIHDFSKEKNCRKLEYLPYHFLLISSSFIDKVLNWRDLTTGEFVANHKLSNYSEKALAYNEANGVVYTGHNSGIVSLWEPKLADPALSFSVIGGTNIISVCPFSTHYVCCATNTNKVFVYDIRNAQNALKCIRLNSNGHVSMTKTQNNLIAIAQASNVTIWKDLNNSSKIEENKYLVHRYVDGTRINSVKSQPFFDVLSLGLTDGFETIIVPGASSSEIDYINNNPFATKKHQATAFIHELLDKLPFDTIMLDTKQFSKII